MSPKSNFKEAIVGLLKKYFNLTQDRLPEEEVLSSVEKSVEFKGANLLVLIFAIFVASLGLNVNSTAVIIGAMLISPLMGPIIGMGFAVGINDFKLLKKSVKNYLVAVFISVITATLYFLISPLSEVQSELLARTSPTIYDVMIALFGGCAGIVAVTTKASNNNVIPGVAIATALMPPLCTVGFGIATGRFMFAAGAIYLFLINSIFICSATYIGVLLMRFRKRAFVNKEREKKVRKYIVAIIIITIVPSIYITWGIVKTTIFNQRVRKFVESELVWNNTQIIKRSSDYSNQSITVALVGDQVSDSSLAVVRSRMQFYDLSKVQLKVIQGAKTDSLIWKNIQSINKNNSERNLVIKDQSDKIKKLEASLQYFNNYQGMGQQLMPEVQVLFPKIKHLSVAPIVQANADTLRLDSFVVAFVGFEQLQTLEEDAKLKEWLKKRIKVDSLSLVISSLLK